jgi:hypothetical protein
MRVVRSELLESQGHINGKLANYLRFLNFTFKHSEDCDDDVTRTRSTFSKGRTSPCDVIICSDRVLAMAS